MIDFTDPILVIGAGSIGERHLFILQRLGYVNIWVYRQRNLPLRIIAAESIQVLTELAEIDTIRPKAAFICTPTAQHLQQALFCAERGIHILVEKPLSHSSAGLDVLSKISSKTSIHIQVGYMLHYHPLLQKMKADIEMRLLGTLLTMQSYWGEYLPDWHPWEDYRQSYAAKRELGGGAALTLSHDIDLLNWFSGSQVQRWSTIKNYHASLAMDVESAADISIAYKNGITAHCHLNFHERKTRRWYRLVFENGTMEMDYDDSSLTIFSKEDVMVHKLPGFDRNQLYEAQTIDFFRMINEKNDPDRTSRNLDESRIIINMCQ